MKGLLVWATVAVTGALVLAAGRDLGVYPERYAMVLFLDQAIAFSLLVWAALSDLRTRLIPNAAPLGIIAVHVALLFPLAAISSLPVGELLTRAAVGAAVVGGGVLVSAILFECLTRRAAFGGGDVKLLAAIGFLLGWERGLLVLFIACLAFVLAVALAGITRGGRGGEQAPSRAPACPATSGSITVAPDTAHPFAPALCIGFFVVLLCF